jgi:hypothetical protein
MPAGATTALIENRDGERIVGGIGRRAGHRGGIHTIVYNGQTINKWNTSADAGAI